MVGCRFGAKNTLDRNYLHLAERGGADVHPERQVVDLRPLPGGGYEVVTERPGAWVRKQRRTFTAEQVVLSAGVLGTMRLLLALREAGRLPHLSERLGHVVRTNSEAIVGAVSDSTAVDYSRGVAITSSIHPDDHTHMEPVRYPPGSNAMGLLATTHGRRRRSGAAAGALPGHGRRATPWRSCARCRCGGGRSEAWCCW